MLGKLTGGGVMLLVMLWVMSTMSLLWLVLVYEYDLATQERGVDG
jgi:hypothetical protein